MHGYEKELRVFVVVKNGVPIGKVIAALYPPDFIDWEKAKELGISVLTAYKIEK